MAPVVSNGFMALDDSVFITENPVVQEARIGEAFTRQLYSPYYKPLVYLSWIVERAVFGNTAWVFHLNNLLLHLLSTVLVYYCFLRIARFWDVTKLHERGIAFFTALLFGLHPLHVESVAWAIERKDMLFGVFFIGGMLTYLKYVDERKVKYLYFTAVLYALCLLSKSMGISLIAVTFLIDWAADRNDWKKSILEKWPLFAVLLAGAVVYGMIYHPATGPYAIAGAGVVSLPPENLAGLPAFYQKILIAGFRYSFFFLHILIPVRLALVYPREFLLAWPGDMIHLVLPLIAAIIVLPLLIRTHRRPWLLAIAFFSITIAPVLADDGAGTNFGSDRYTYIPSLGVFFMICTLGLYFLSRPVGRIITAGHGVLAVICIILGFGTFAQSLKWGDSYALFDQAVRNYPGNWVALHYRGSISEKDGDREAALADFDQSIAINPLSHRVRYSRGTLLLNMQRWHDAIEDFSQSLMLQPRQPNAWTNRGNAYRQLGQNGQAIADYNEALAQNPGMNIARNNRGVAYLNLGNFDAALADFNQVIADDPAYINAYINRAAVNINQAVRRYAPAVEDYDRVLAMDPGNVQALYFRGVALRHLGRFDEALQSVSQAIMHSPNTGMYYFTRAQIFRSLGRHDASLQDARQAQALGYRVPQEYLDFTGQ